ncbi:MAG: helix-turn-helix domain-containing protein [Candidatus Dormibacteria bacterium]
MDKTPGRREAHKRATRSALQQAARRLFAEQGYEVTTAAQIASAAHVAERTLYRYFDGKEDLLAEEALAGIELLRRAILERPIGEAPWVAVSSAMRELLESASEGAHGILRLLTDLRQPVVLLRRSGSRPFLRLEEAIEGAVWQRLRAEAQPGLVQAGERPPAELQAQLVAALATVALRLAIVSHRRLEAHGVDSPGLLPLLRQTLAAVQLVTAPAPGRAAE